MKGSLSECRLSEHLRLRYSHHARNVSLSLSLSHVHQLSKTFLRWVLCSPAGFRRAPSKTRKVSTPCSRFGEHGARTYLLQPASSRAQLSSIKASCRKLSRERPKMNEPICWVQRAPQLLRRGNSASALDSTWSPVRACYERHAVPVQISGLSRYINRRREQVG